MNIIRRPGWTIPEREATPESVFFSRRSFVAATAAAAASVGVPGAAFAQRVSDVPDPTANLYPAKRNEAFTLDRPLTEESVNAGYNNFFEFGPTKSIARAAQALKTRPWTIKIDGMVEKPFEIGIDDLIRKFPLEERLTRLRCVEAWSMTVPWTGFPMARIVELAKPLSSAKYVRMESFLDKATAPEQRKTWYPWPYVEGLTIAEATNELAFMVTGAYGKPLPKQHGAPIRLSVPWKYGFKHAKSIVRFNFTDKRPRSYWEDLQASEYGFWANVNPEVSHPRWSQASEELLGRGERRPTLLFNGYAEYVASLYKGLENERLWA